jgi:putative membrane protein (TIGR04086 family)
MSILYGVLSIFIIITISSLIISLILRFTDLQEHSINLFVTILSFAALFIGGFICGGKGRQKGWLVGGMTGVSYTFLIFLMQYLGYGHVFSFSQIVYHICYIITAMMGGVLGVNVLSNRSEKF